MRIIQRLSQSFTCYGAKILHTVLLVLEITWAMRMPTRKCPWGPQCLGSCQCGCGSQHMNPGTRPFLATDLLKLVRDLHIYYRALWLGVGALRPHMDHHPLWRRGREAHECSTRAVDESNASNVKLAYIRNFYKRSDLKTFKILHQYWIPGRLSFEMAI